MHEYQKLWRRAIIFLTSINLQDEWRRSVQAPETLKPGI
jgi:hypothetical protein